MAGQSVGLVHRIQPTAEIVAELIEQAAAALARERAHAELAVGDVA
jgi:enoyl-[acyl-carrier protein] reductase II